MNAISPPRIVTPGIYEMASEAYHADPCDTPSLSAGMINDILLAPAKCRENSRRLNPDYEDAADDGKFTIGSVSHVMFLEPHLFETKVLVVKADDWRSGAAKSLRALAAEEGKIAILEKHMDKIHAARAKFMAHAFTREAFSNGVAERSMFWKHPTYGFWCRARPDFIADGGTHLNDYKATTNADPNQFGKHAYAMGYHRRAAWYLDGIEAITRLRPGHYWFVNQETKPPYLVSVVELDELAIEAGRAENERASATFARCLETGDWFGYRHRDALDRDLAFRVGLPGWAMMQIEEKG